MSTPAAIDDCASCGALFSRYPGDGGVCEECQEAPASKIAWDSKQTNTRPAPPAAPPVAAPPRVAAPKPAAPRAATLSALRAATLPAARPAFRERRRFPGRLIGALVALLVLGSATWWIRTHEKTLSRWWSTRGRHEVSDAWTAVRREALNGWAVVRSHLPGDTEENASAAPPPRAVRDGTSSRGTHRRDKRR